MKSNEPGDDHELLESETSTCMGPTVEYVHEGHWQDVWLLGAGKIANVGVERDALLSSGGLRHGHGNTEDGIGAELGLVLRAVKRVEELVDR